MLAVMTKRLLRLLLVWVLGIQFELATGASTLQLDAPKIFEQSVSHDLGILDTETPSFESFRGEIDGGEKKSVASSFTWTLHPGKNQMRLWPRNTSGREGIPSWITMEYTDAH